MTPFAPIDLQDVVAELARRHPDEPALGDPLTILVNETIGYMIDDEKRAALLDEFKARVGIDPRAILAADRATLLDITRRGGMAPDKRAERLVEIGRLVLETCGGDLAVELRKLPTPKARKLLEQFPSIGEPGADRILLFGDYAAVPAVDSNGLRAMVRLGFLIERPNWSQTYKDAVHVIAERGLPDTAWLKTAYLVLRAHGKELCKRSSPICLPCPFDAGCAHAVTTTL